MISVNDYYGLGVLVFAIVVVISTASPCHRLALRKKYLINDNDIAQHLFESMLSKTIFTFAC